MLHSVTSRPAGVTGVSALLAVKGVVSLATAASLIVLDGARLTNFDGILALGKLAIGLVLLVKAYALLKMHRGAWLVVMGFLAVDALLSILKIAHGGHTLVAWMDFILTVAALAYLSRPDVRRLFHPRHAHE